MHFDMNLVDRIRRAVANPKLFARGLNRAYHRRGGRRSFNPRGVDVFSEDWDTLVILDACRYDAFETTNSIPGTLTARLSKGSATTEWLRANFHERDLTDTVYTTANPQLARHRDQWDVNLHRTNDVWLEEGWDEHTGTVLAETMTEAALAAVEDFPHKRHVVHYMQPHYPFVQSSTTFDENHLDTIKAGNDGPAGENVWNQKFLGHLDVSREQLWRLYRGNLEYVLEHVESLLDELTGKTVVTSDHGNYVGERASPVPIREYGHPRGLYDDMVVRVPWLEHESGSRREIVADTAADPASVDTEVIEQRLEHLGYKN